ncbi:penicillin acylase family protein [Nannocystis sp.]|uniref:penicillin acylase family protein n=1 Tax=Nannocystis sp. TaxID=1962667 RepID=UPI0025D464D0|nr:penicillin acylase family protein [Nannocystis sp.]MBK7823742.1 penicillin acylase family protein [Nannocystis sp.]
MMLPRCLTLLALLSTPSLLACGGGSAGEAEGGSSETGEELGDPELFPGLRAEVEILIDDRGIPHIYAEHERDLFYAAGYQMATDRLFQIDLMRRRAYGRGAEVLGPSKVDEDKISRLFNFKRWGTLDAERLKAEAPADYALFSAWIAGVNARIDEIKSGAAPLPYGFGPAEADYQPERWDNVDTFVIAKMIMFGNSNTLEYEFLASVVQRLAKDAYASIELLRPGMPTFTMPPEDRPKAGAGATRPDKPGPDALAKLQATAGKAVPPDAAAALARMHSALSGFHVLGSNNWAVDGRFTDNGKPLICNDPHQPLQSPSVMYAQHLNTADKGGTFDAAGFGFAGAPGVQLGHNRHIQWAATTGFADCMDLYAVSSDGKTITAGTKKPAITKRSEEIKVKGGTTVVLAVSDVDGYGVLLGDALPFPEALVVDANRHVLINWTGFRATNEAAAFLAMGRASSVSEWETAVEKMEVGTFNWLAADKDGISYHLSTLVPDRGDPSAHPMPYTVVDGDDPSYYWTGKNLTADKLPRSHADKTGFIVTANNEPFGFTADGDVHNDPWYYGAFFDPGYRGARIEARLQELTKKGKLSVKDMQAVQTDTHSGLADQLLPVLAEVYAKVPSDEELATFRDRPELDTLVKLMTIDWNRSMQQDQPGALAFHAFAHFLATQVYEDDLLLTFGPIMEASAVTALKLTSLAVTGAFPDGDGVMKEGRDVLVMSALSDTAGWLGGEFGSVNPAMYSWGERHGTGFRNGFGGELDGGWVATHGGEDTVNVSSTVFYEPNTTTVNKQFESHDGPVFRVVTRFLDDGTPEAYMNFPRGNSGEPTSPHFADTVEDWRNGVYTKYPYTRAEVEATKPTRIVLAP